MSLCGKDLICTQDWQMHELITILNTAVQMKLNRYSPKWLDILKNKSFLMMFYSPSMRTHLSFTTAVTELGGHAEYLDPNKMSKMKSETTPGETIEDAAKVISNYMCGIGIRIMETALSAYGKGHEMIREYANHATIPVINMADDVCHPCQSLADVMGWAEWFSKGLDNINFSCLKKKKLLVTWAHGAMARSLNSPQGNLLLSSRMGLDITIARPQGYDFDALMIEKIKNNCNESGGSLNIIDDPIAGYEGADIVYSRNWVSQHAYRDGVFNKEKEITQALQYPSWITTLEKMQLTNNAIFTHPMPIDRGSEVADSVANSKNSVIYNVAANRLHVQKSILAHTIGILE
ncbi:MAG: hypothetical protein A3F18_00405 [Legionellales bacterium RIFCSPHIGHO2_12_FULL_37_14]|nr:MAG: hypothetical protein A3F18_00405 [Legionellales bacterium RIFCSPHIGHO2_12_FULL_37_14]